VTIVAARAKSPAVISSTNGRIVALPSEKVLGLVNGEVIFGLPVSYRQSRLTASRAAMTAIGDVLFCEARKVRGPLPNA
jgi:hypothetical protein